MLTLFCLNLHIGLKISAKVIEFMESEVFEPDIQTLGYYVDRALCVMIKLLNKELKEANLRFQHSDYTIMRILSEKDSLTQSDLARILGKERSAISRSLTSLEKEGYVRREKVNGCTNHVFLTGKGKKIMPVLNEIANKVSDKAMLGVSYKERKEIMSYLTLIYRNSMLGC